MAEWSRLDLEEFVESGLLLHVNRAVLWPLGLALTVKKAEDGTCTDLYVSRIDPWETIVDDADETTRKREVAFEAWIAQRIAGAG
jgi:hypothetical protein